MNSVENKYKKTLTSHFSSEKIESYLYVYLFILMKKISYIEVDE
jgi:hypothetical protein